MSGKSREGEGFVLMSLLRDPDAVVHRGPSRPVSPPRLLKGADSFYFPQDQSISYRNDRALAEKPRWGSRGPHQPGPAPLSPQGMSLEPLGAGWRRLEMQNRGGGPRSQQRGRKQPRAGPPGPLSCRPPWWGSWLEERGSPPAQPGPWTLVWALLTGSRSRRGPLALRLWTHEELLASQPLPRPLGSSLE